MSEGGRGGVHAGRVCSGAVRHRQVVFSFHAGLRSSAVLSSVVANWFQCRTLEGGPPSNRGDCQSHAQTSSDGIALASSAVEEAVSHRRGRSRGGVDTMGAGFFVSLSLSVSLCLSLTLSHTFV